MAIRQYLKEQNLLFDGGMGTYYAERNETAADACELASITNPKEIEAIHRAYLAAGCRAIKTNTYAVNRLRMSETDCRALISAACEIARENVRVNALDDRLQNIKKRFLDAVGGRPGRIPRKSLQQYPSG